MMPTLRQLEYVIAVADLKHFGEAARRCGVSQPALSKQVQEVEQLLSVVIFERARAGVFVTRAGEAVVAQAKRVIEEAKALEAAASASLEVLGGRVTLGLIPTLAPYVLPGLLGALREAAPKARWVVHERQTHQLLEGLYAGEIDCGLLALPVAEGGLAGQDLFDESFVLVAPSDHALASKHWRVNPQRLSGESLLLLEEGHCLRDQALTFCAKVDAPEVDIRATSLPTLLAMVEAGIGVTLAPALSITQDMVRSKVLCVRHFQAPSPRRRIGLRWRQTSPRRFALAALSGVFEAHAQALAEQAKRVLSEVPGGEGAEPPLRVHHSPKRL